MSRSLILYDGVCGLCNRLNQFVLKRDRHDSFRLASLQSELAHSLLRRYGRDAYDLNTLYLVTDYGNTNERIWSQSSAAIRILSQLGGGWKILSGVMRICPAPLRDIGYGMLAAVRYRIFGKFEACLIPSEEWKHKFLDVAPMGAIKG